MAKYCVICLYYDDRRNQRLGRSEIEIPGKLTNSRIREAEVVLEEHFKARELIIVNLIKLRRIIGEQQE